MAELQKDQGILQIRYVIKQGELKLVKEQILQKIQTKTSKINRYLNRTNQ